MDSREAIRQNIAFYLSQSGASQIELARAVGTSKSSVSAWIAGETVPRMDKIEKMAAFFGVAPSDLMKDRGAKLRIPVLGRVQAGLPTTANQEVLDYVDISEAMAAQGDLFALYVHGESMLPDFREGDIAIVRRQPSLDDGQIGVFSIGGDEATIKEYMAGKNHIFLKPHNDAFPVLMYSFQEVDLLPVLVLGKVIELRRSYV